MPFYLVQVAYNDKGLGSLVNNPQNRIEAITPTIENMGGKVKGGWFAFGEYDVVLVIEMPNNVSAVALFMAASAGGSLKSYKTTPLISAEESVKAMRIASKSGYQPPT